MKYILSTDALQPSEVNLLKTIIRLSSDLGDRWVIGEAQLSHVLFQDFSAFSESSVERSDAKFVVPIARAFDPVTAPRFLIRPIKVDEVGKLLRELEVFLVPRNTADSSASNSTASDPVQAGAPSHMLAKLKRWPSQTALGDGTEGIQLATLLSRKPLTVQKLSELSGRDIHVCQAFVQTLDRLNFLAWTQSEVAPETDASKQMPNGGASSVSRRLLRGIRKRLGLA